MCFMRKHNFQKILCTCKFKSFNSQAVIYFANSWEKKNTENITIFDISTVKPTGLFFYIPLRFKRRISTLLTQWQTKYLMKITVRPSFPRGASGKELPAKARDTSHGFDPLVGKILSGGHGNPLQYSCLENLMDRRSQWATDHRVTKSRTQLEQFSMYAHTIRQYFRQ